MSPQPPRGAFPEGPRIEHVYHIVSVTHRVPNSHDALLIFTMQDTLERFDGNRVALSPRRAFSLLEDPPCRQSILPILPFSVFAGVRLKACPYVKRGEQSCSIPLGSACYSRVLRSPVHRGHGPASTAPGVSLLANTSLSYTQGPALFRRYSSPIIQPQG